MTDKTYRHIDMLIKLITPILLSFSGWAFFQFWETARELKDEVRDMRYDVLRFNEECKVAIIRNENSLNLHIFQTEKTRQQ